MFYFTCQLFAACEKLLRWLQYTLHEVSTNGTMSMSSGYDNKVAATITERFHCSY